MNIDMHMDRDMEKDKKLEMDWDKNLDKNYIRPKWKQQPELYLVYLVYLVFYFLWMKTWIIGWNSEMNFFEETFK